MYALVLTNWNLANSSTSQKQSNKERLMREVYYMQFSLASIDSSFVAKSTIIYNLHWRGAFGVARFDLSGNARASIRETGDRIGSSLFVCISNIISSTRESVGSNC